ncbi:MAG: metallophosphoesterase [Myxococcales bacterium]|nr:metallophosphoesterase [Myxococcales bacterium]
MNKTIWLIAVFGAVLLGLVGLTHWLLYQRLVVATALPAPWRQIAAIAIVLLGLSLPLAFVLQRLVDAPAMRPVAVGAFVWMGLVFLLVLGIAMVGLLGWGHDKVADFRGLVVDPERRLFLARLLGGAAAGGALLAGASALHEALRFPQLRRVEIKLRKLPKGLDGLTIVQVSDLHVGVTIQRQWVEKLVIEINKLRPDIVALTGDLVDGPVAALREHVAPFANVQARLGTFLVTGNHEYYSGADQWIAVWQQLGVRVLRNECVTVQDGDHAFDLAGVDDWTAARFGLAGHGHDVAKALRGRDTSRELVLLAHQPKSIYEAADHGVGLQLSGHTHGGQIWPFGWLVRLVQPYVAGLYLHGATWIYVSRGTGFWGPPMRLSAPSELTQLVLRAA